MATMTRPKTKPEAEWAWSPEELAELAELEAKSGLLPEEAPRALLSIRLSILTEDTTSPARQELDLRRYAVREGIRIIGVARDLGVSATKQGPFKRKELGDWLNNRIPEFDVILFWKLDRFIRRITDLHEVIKYCEKFNKNLVSLNDTLDLSSPMAQAMVTFIAAVAEIEAANTKTRVISLWEYTKASDLWRIGKPSYGYKTAKIDGKIRLVQDPEQAKVVRYMYRATVRGLPANRIALILNRAKVPTYSNGTWNNQQVLRTLRNPAVRGVRTEGGTKGENYRSSPVLDKQGKEIMVTDEPILTAEEFEQASKALDVRKKNKRRAPTDKRPTRFLGVIKHLDCGENLNETNNFAKLSKTGEVKEYRYIRCPHCRRPGFSFPDPDGAYAAIAAQVSEKLGDIEVVHREYARGDENRKERKRLEDSVEYYMAGLAPGGRFDKQGFIKEKAEETLTNLMEALQKIDPESTKDRWVYTPTGQTYRDHWKTGGLEAMEEDLLRTGVEIHIDKSPEGSIRLKLKVPKGLERMLVKKTAFND